MSKHAFLRGALVIVLLVATVFSQQTSNKKQKPTQSTPPEQILWIDPGDVPSLDLRYGVGGRDSQPQPPFYFIEEDMSGTTPKINVRDDRGVIWNLKWGAEASASIFCTRLAWACGYVTEPEYFVALGQIEGVHGLTRAKSHVSRDGSFTAARFQLRSGRLKYLKDRRWKWADNPFLNSQELQGLKLLTLLVSNMDAKNVNLGVFADGDAANERYLYAVTDWGGSLGKWGNPITRSIGDCKGFAAQTPQLVKGVKDGRLRWTFSGKHRTELTADILVTDVQWLLQYLGRVTDEQIRDGLSASGESPEDTECYATALRQRIVQLQNAVGESTPPIN
jgi:hypothetical protein